MCVATDNEQVELGLGLIARYAGVPADQQLDIIGNAVCRARALGLPEEQSDSAAFKEYITAARYIVCKSSAAVASLSLLGRNPEEEAEVHICTSHPDQQTHVVAASRSKYMSERPANRIDFVRSFHYLSSDFGIMVFIDV